MKANFDPFINRVIDRYEGPYGWDAGDAGGPTKYGITCYDLAEERHQKMTSMAAWAPIVKAMPRTEAVLIYENKYEAGTQFDVMPSGPDVVRLDYGINSGIGRVVRVDKALLAKAGKQAVQDCDPTWYVNAMCAERLAFLQGLRNWNEFKGGWSARVADVRTYGLHLVAGTTFIPPTAAPVPPHPKGTHAPADHGPVVAGGGGAVVTGTVTAAQHGVPTWVIVGGVVVAVAGLAYVLARQQSAIIAANAAVILPASIPAHP